MNSIMSRTELTIRLLFSLALIGAGAAMCFSANYRDCAWMLFTTGTMLAALTLVTHTAKDATATIRHM